MLSNIVLHTTYISYVLSVLKIFSIYFTIVKVDAATPNMWLAQGPGVHDKHQEMGVKSRHRSFPGGFFNRITVTTLPETNSEFAPENGGPLEVWRFLLETRHFKGLLLLGFRELQHPTSWWMVPPSRWTRCRRVLCSCAALDFGCAGPGQNRGRECAVGVGFYFRLRAGKGTFFFLMFGKV